MPITPQLGCKNPGFVQSVLPCGRPHKRLLDKRIRSVCRRTQPRAEIRSAAEADWIIVDVALRGVDDGMQTLATELQRDGRALVKRALHNEPAELSLVLCSDDEILQLNKNWRGKEKPTDVLSFPQNDEVILGDIVISVDTAKRQAEARRMEIQEELRVLLVHGLLHLMGYDHEKSETDLQIMANAEKSLMKDLGWPGEGLISYARHMSSFEDIHQTKRA